MLPGQQPLQVMSGYYALSVVRVVVGGLTGGQARLGFSRQCARLAPQRAQQAKQSSEHRHVHNATELDMLAPLTRHRAALTRVRATAWSPTP